MSRKGKGYTGPQRRVTDEQSITRFEANLDRLSDLCEDYDRGRISYALPMAVEIHKLLTEGGAYSTRRRSTVTYPSPADEDRESNLLAYFRLTFVRIASDNEGPFGTFIHAFEAGGTKIKAQKFKHWWNETVTRASAAVPGTPAGVIPVNDSPSVPFKDRARLNRRELIRLLRNSAGAHEGAEYPEILDEVDDPRSWGGFAMNDGNTGLVYSTDDGSLKWRAGQLAASTRQIAEEILIAFGRRTLPVGDAQNCIPPATISDNGDVLSLGFRS